MIEERYDIAFVANLARREKQIQQSYRPVIAVHKWFARRPGTLFRSLLLAEFSDLPLREAFYLPGNLAGKTIADPFMGGGTPLMEANRMGAHVLGRDINPMAYWIVRQEMEGLSLEQYLAAASALRTTLEQDIGPLYRTRCALCGRTDAAVKYFLWVKTTSCPHCGEVLNLFPGYLVAEAVRHPKNVFVCARCGQLTETTDRQEPGLCVHCRAPLLVAGPAKNNRCRCGRCGETVKYAAGADAPARHRLFALEYHCFSCKPKHQGRFFKAPDDEDFEKVAEADRRLAALEPRHIPDDEIPPGDESTRLHRWGYRHYRDLFNARQLLGLESSCRLIAAHEDERVRNALATNLSDLLRYQNMLCRYDTTVLKSLDIFSVHGFPVGLVQCESNLLGIGKGRGAAIGSGGWLNIVEKYAKAKAFCEKPFEVRHQGTGKNGRKIVVAMPGEWIGDAADGRATRVLDIRRADAAACDWTPDSLDAVLTDPPYFGNVQYAELMDFCYVWLRRLVGKDDPAFFPLSTRHSQELTGNDSMGRGLDHFTAGLARAFSRAGAALKPGAPFAFTYHHNDITAYFPVAVAMLDAGFVCTAVLPCPGEMGASIHIKGTASSTVDSVFVCRRRGDCAVPESEDIGAAARNDMEALRAGGLRVTPGDARCIVYGRLIRQAVNELGPGWQARLLTRADAPENSQEHAQAKLDILAQWFAAREDHQALCRLAEAGGIAPKDPAAPPTRQLVLPFAAKNDSSHDAVPF